MSSNFRWLIALKKAPNAKKTEPMMKRTVPKKDRL
jgi:hypothetical protein